MGENLSGRVKWECEMGEILTGTEDGRRCKAGEPIEADGDYLIETGESAGATIIYNVFKSGAFVAWNKTLVGAREIIKRHQGKETTEPRRLHLGCGRNIKPGWVNLDRVEGPGVDVVADLDACRTWSLPWLPFPENHFDHSLAQHLIEHLRHPLPFMQELHRITKPGGTAEFAVPYGSSDDAFEDPTHVRQYFLQSWCFFGQPAYWRADYQYRGDWQIETVKLVVCGTRYKGASPDDILGEIHYGRNIVQEMTAMLRCVKPIREPRKELQVGPKVQLVLI